MVWALRQSTAPGKPFQGKAPRVTDDHSLEDKRNDLCGGLPVCSALFLGVYVLGVDASGHMRYSFIP